MRFVFNEIFGLELLVAEGSPFCNKFLTARDFRVRSKNAGKRDLAGMLVEEVRYVAFFGL